MPRGCGPVERRIPGPQVEVEEEFDVLFTRRSLSLRLYPGLTVLPGGKMDPTDASVVDTALREAKEEVGLQPSSVRVLGVLPPLLLRHGHLTYAVVGFLDDCERVWRRPVNKDEIDSVFRLPLHRFLSTRHVHGFVTRLQHPINVLVHTIGLVNFVPGETSGESGQLREVWGMTATFVIETAMLAYGQQPQFPDFYVWPGIRPNAESVRRCHREACLFYADLLISSAKI